LKSLINLTRLTKALNIHLLHTDGPRNTFYASIVKIILQIPVIWHIRVSNRDYFDRILIHFCDRLILVANRLKNRFSWANNESKFVTVYNGVDLKEFIPADTKTKTAAQSTKQATKYVIGMVGRVERPKGQIHLIEACAYLGVLKDQIELLFAGKIIEPDYLKKCQQAARTIGIEKNTHFIGYRDDIRLLLQKIDIFTFTSIDDAFPRTIIEAMGAGIPVITSDVGGCPEAVEEGVTGFVVPKKDPAAIADRILKITDNHNTMLAMGIAGRRRAKNLFSIENNVRRIEQIYSEVLTGNG